MAIGKPCVWCKHEVLVHPDDHRPVCLDCERMEFEYLVIKEHLSGRLDHLNESVQEGLASGAITQEELDREGAKWQ
jgi:hypothetical protein